jgi:hypothetical protein
MKNELWSDGWDTVALAAFAGGMGAVWLGREL